MYFSYFSSCPPSLVTALLTVISSVYWTCNRDGFHTTSCCWRFFFPLLQGATIFFSVNLLSHYYKGSDSCHRHLSGRSPHLLQLTFRTFRSQPLGRLSYRFIRHDNVTDDFQASSWNRRLAALPCRIGFVILRTAFSLPVALHPISQ
jgi:hypothetical protein